MAFDPRSDVVLEVLRAADPARAAAATQRLTALAGAGAPDAEAFDATLAATSASSRNAEPVAEASNARARLAAVGATPDKAARAKVEFEAMLLSSFVNQMLPKDADATFGKGFAGEAWRSMLADQAARQIARSGALGIGKRLFASHDIAATSHGRAASAPAAAQASSNALSLPAAGEFRDGSALFRSPKTT
jgi:Rod binding domain-containing protein